MIDDNQAFYIGYMPKAPNPLSRWLRPRVTLLLFIALIVPVPLVISMSPFGPSVFEFGTIRAFEGVIIEKPYPMLVLDRPGQIPQTAKARSRYFLTVFGKQGAQADVSGLDGHRVRLEGELIYRDNQTMIQIKANSLQDLGANGVPAGGISLGNVELSGEIVDSKCFLGVMNPGNLKTHKACAIRCISGGIPPVLLVRSTQGAHYFLLAGPQGEPIHKQILDWVAEPIKISGMLERHDDMYILKADPNNIIAVKTP